MKTVTIPTEQVKILTTGLNAIGEAIKVCQEEDFLKFDIYQLKALLNTKYKLQVVMTDQQRDSFTSENGVDIPTYVELVDPWLNRYIQEPLTLKEFSEHADKVVNEFLQNGCEYHEEKHDIVLKLGDKETRIALNAESYELLIQYMAESKEIEEEYNQEEEDEPEPENTKEAKALRQIKQIIETL